MISAPCHRRDAGHRAVAAVAAVADDDDDDADDATASNDNNRDNHPNHIFLSRHVIMQTCVNITARPLFLFIIVFATEVTIIATISQHDDDDHAAMVALVRKIVNQKVDPGAGAVGGGDTVSIHVGITTIPTTTTTTTSAAYYKIGRTCSKPP